MIKENKNNLVLEVKNLYKNFENNVIFKDLDFSLKKGEFISIMGPSGIGKTTFINILLGLDTNFKGEYIKYFKKLSCVFQEDRLLPWLSLIDNIKVVNPQVNDKKIVEILELMKLSKFAHYPPLKLSGGMKQRASIARALSCDFDLVIMDEPLKSTDKDLSSSILDYLSTKLKDENKSLILITHDTDTALSISDKIYIMQNKPAQFIDCINVKNGTSLQTVEKLQKYALLMNMQEKKKGENYDR